MHGAGSPDFLVHANRLFDPDRVFEGHRGIAYGGPDLSDRNLRLLSSLRAGQDSGAIPRPAIEISGTGDITSGRMAVEYALRGCTSFQLHTFFQLDDGSCLAFFEAPDMPFEFKEQHDFDLHIALEVTPDALDKMFAKGKAEGREVRGVSDHRFIRSIYFRDPNGYVIELAAKVAGHESAMDPKKSHARDILNSWQTSKRQPAKVA